jgi:hypothetical protein
MLLCGQVNRIWHYWCGRYPGSVGVLISPAYYQRVPIDNWMPFALDNDAYMAWRDNKLWNVEAWREMLVWVGRRGLPPLWCAVPDVVTDREATIANWDLYSPEILKRGWKTAFCVQDGMTPDDVPDNADVIFVGGSDGWKFKNLTTWVNNFPRVHCGRVNALEMVEACEREGCESVDGTGWFRDPSRQDKLPAIGRFIAGHRNNQQSLFQKDNLLNF